MSAQHHAIHLQSSSQFDGKLPPHHVGLLLAEIPHAVREAISMSLRNRSRLRGKLPNWLERAADIRFVGHEGNGATTLHFEAPSLGEAASELYRQQELPGLSTRPAAEDTGFDLLGDVLTDIDRRDADSERYDDALLDRVTRLRRFFQKRSPFTAFDITTRRHQAEQPAKVTVATVEAAEALRGRTPTPQRVRLVGQLDRLEASTQRFSVLLDGGEKVVGVFRDEQGEELRSLWDKRVLVLGMAIYRPSGRLLRIEAEAVKPGENEAAMFSRLPVPANGRIDVEKLRRLQGPRSGMAALMGQWPGDETDAEVEAALELLS